MGPDAEYTVHTNFRTSRTLLQTPVKLTLDYRGHYNSMFNKIK